MFLKKIFFRAACFFVLEKLILYSKFKFSITALRCGCKFQAVQKNIRLILGYLFQRFSLYLSLTFLLLLYLCFFHFISFHGTIYFFFIIYAFFLLFFVDFIIFMFMFIGTRLYWDGLFTKKEFTLSLSCVSGTIIVSVLDVQRFIEVKTSTSVSPISLLWWLLFVFWNVVSCWSCLALGFYCIFVALLRAEY